MKYISPPVIHDIYKDEILSMNHNITSKNRKKIDFLNKHIGNNK